jgi:general secretion pathway protein A
VTFLEHFGFIEQPFGVTPDPRFLHLGPQHREALASLVCATEENRGFVALIAPPGTGKTTLLFQYLEGFRHGARTAFLFQNAHSTKDLMHYLLADIGIATSASDLPELNEMLNRVLRDEMRAGRRFVLVIDEAQNLGPEVLESVRLLSNFETPWMKLMQIVLAGQPQLATQLARPSMAQLRQRISSLIRLQPFTPEETNAYINHRLWVAGCADANLLFTVGARTSIAEHSNGIPRNINNLCYQSLMLAHAAGKQQVKAEMVREVLSDLAVESLVPSARDGTGLRSGGRVATESASIAQARSPLTLASTRRRRILPAIASISTVLFLSIVSGVLWRVNSHTKPLGVTPSAEAAALPARSTALAPTPETMSPISEMASIIKTAPSGKPSIRDAVDAARGKVLDDRVFSVVVARGTTLRHVSLQYLGRYDPADLAAILSLNPKITNPDEIQAGQEVRLPLSLLRDSATNARDATEISPAPATEGAR